MQPSRVHSHDQVIVEQELQPVDNPDEYSLGTSNIQDGARLDVATNGFWGSQSERCFIDVRVFNPYNMLLPINVSHFLLPTGSMKTSSVVLMAKGLERWNMPLLHLLFCRGYLMKPPFSTNVWLPFCRLM